MEKLKLQIHNTFIVFASLLIYFGKTVLFCSYLLVMLIHELSHAFVAKRLGYNIKNIKLIPFGICLNINSSDITPKDEIKIAIAGPLSNFILVIFVIAIWWIVPASYNYTYLFCYANFVTAFFNLIPAFPLDGGRIFLSILRQENTDKRAVAFCKIVNIIICFILLILFIISCFYEINLTYLFVIFCVLSGVFDTNKAQQYSFINYSNMKKKGKIVKIKSLFVNENEKLYKICKYIDNYSYINLYIADNEYNINSVLNEKQFLTLIEKCSASQTFKLALKTIKK